MSNLAGLPLRVLSRSALERRMGEVEAERDRARDLCARLAGINLKREELLWLAIEADTALAQAAAGRVIAQHLRETAYVPGMDATC